MQYRYHVNAIHPGSVLHSHTQRAGRASLRKRGGKGKSRKMGELRATGATSVDASAIALAGTVANAGSGGDGESAAGASSTGGPGERERGGETDTLGARAGPTRLLSNYRLRSFRHIRRVGFRESVPHGTGRRPVLSARRRLTANANWGRRMRRGLDQPNGRKTDWLWFSRLAVR